MATLNAAPRYKRILLKPSGEAMRGTRGFGLDLDTVETIARQISAVHNRGVQVAVVVVLLACTLVGAQEIDR